MRNRLVRLAGMQTPDPACSGQEEHAQGGFLELGIPDSGRGYVLSDFQRQLVPFSP